MMISSDIVKNKGIATASTLNIFLGVICDLLLEILNIDLQDVCVCKATTYGFIYLIKFVSYRNHTVEELRV